MNSKFTMSVRILLGLILVIFGVNSFAHFIPMEMPSGKAADFLNSLGATGYLLPVLGILEIFIGIMLLLKRWVPFVVILLAPISLNILLFHLFIAPAGVWIALLIAIMNGILMYKHWRLYKPLFS